MSKHVEKKRNESRGLLNWIERMGNRLPDPVSLFVLGAIGVVILSQVADSLDWTVTKTVLAPVMKPVIDSGTGEPIEILQMDPDGTIRRSADGETVRSQVVVTPVEDVETGKAEQEQAKQEVRATGLLTRDGLNWAISSMVKNFVNFPPLGVVLVGMLGIGVAEKTGAIGTLLKAAMLVTPQRLLTPSMVFVGVMSSMALDAGYIILPPVAAALYKAVGRSPLVGLAAVFSGVSAGFSANLLPTGLDPLLAGFTESGAQVLDPTYRVAATCNWWFMIASTIMLTLVGWAVTAWFVEPRYASKTPSEGGPVEHQESEDSTKLTADERRGLSAATVGFLVAFGILMVMILYPGAPLYGRGARFARWVEAIVPILFLMFLVPGILYGVAVGKIRSDRQTAKLMSETMADMGPYIVLAFFAAQFIEYFKFSKLGEMLAIVGGQTLANANLPTGALLIAFVLVVMVANLFIGSASAKYAFLAPVFIPMFMAEGVNISPELTQAAYRVGDSVSNVVAPLNPYIIIVLVFIQRYVPKAGIGTLISLMLPYSIAFFVIWSIMLVLWIQTGVNLGPGGPLTYP
ncbi:MAG: AbgT family transporter [Pirellulaceae bacterium]|nr:AbgT family transporter [Pirellulaceae bacterium]